MESQTREVAADAPGAPQVTTVTVGAFQENCYLVADPTSGAAALVDPGAEGERVVEMVRASGARLEAVWLTHAHLDHIGALADVLRVWDVPVYLHPLDLPVFEFAPQAARMYGLYLAPQPRPRREFADGQALPLGALRFDVMHAPGHAPGHVVVHGHGVAFVGDCLFFGSIGRTDLPMASPRDLRASLRRIAALPPDTVAYPGHGPPTTVGRERVHNPFLNGGARPLGG